MKKYRIKECYAEGRKEIHYDAQIRTFFFIWLSLKNRRLGGRSLICYETIEQANEAINKDKNYSKLKVIRYLK